MGELAEKYIDKALRIITLEQRIAELEHERDQLRDRVADLQFDLRALTDHEAFKNAEDVIERDS
jgi:cell division protein FtsB